MYQSGDRVRVHGNAMHGTVVRSNVHQVYVAWDGPTDLVNWWLDGSLEFVGTDDTGESTEQDTLLAWSMDAGLLGGTLLALRGEIAAAVSDLHADFNVVALHRLERAIVTTDGALARTQRFGKS